MKQYREGRRVSPEMLKARSSKAVTKKVGLEVGKEQPAVDKHARGSFLSALTSLTVSNISPVPSTPAPPVASATPTHPIVSNAPSVQKSVTAPVLSENDRRMRIIDGMRNGLTDQQLAIKFDSDLASVMRIRKEFIKTAKMNDPRALFSKRLADIDEAFEIAKDKFFDDPGNETYMKGMNDFAKTLRELIQSYNDLEDPRAVADVMVRRVIRPLTMGQLTPIVEALSNLQVEMSSFLPEHARGMVETSIVGAVKKLRDTTKIEYNRAVETLSQMFEVDLNDMRLNNASEVSDAQDASKAS